MIDSIRKNMTWSAVLIAGLAAGTVHLLTNLLLTPLVLEVDGAIVIRYFASLMLGSAVVDDHNAQVLIVGLLVHYLLSLLFTLLIAIVIHRWGLAVGVLGGALLGLALYGINLYTMTVIFQWFFAINSTVLLLSHVLFGAVAGGVYELFDHFDLPLVPEENR